MTTQNRSIPKGTQVFVGAPAERMPQERLDRIAEALDEVPQVLEAHLPQCYAVGHFDPPAQVLVIVVDPKSEPQSVVNTVGIAVGRALPEHDYLDIWPVSQGELVLSDIRAANCIVKGNVLAPSRKPWWRFR